MAVPGNKIKLAEDKETRQLKVENQYLKEILDKLYRIIINGDATLQKELKPPEEIKNDQRLAELTINIEKVIHKFYELQTELNYILRKVCQLSSTIILDEGKEEKTPSPERTSKFTATGRKPRRNPTHTTEQLERSFKLDTDLELVTSTLRDMKEKEKTIISQEEIIIQLRLRIAALEQEVEGMKKKKPSAPTSQRLLSSMGNTSSSETRINDIELQASDGCTDKQPPGKIKAFFASFSDWMLGRTTWSSGDETQPLTQQSDDEMPLNLMTNGQEGLIDQLHLKIALLEQQLEELKKEKKIILYGYGQLFSMFLMEGNPNIADLSDPNRLDKVGEQFSELYDNQWTDCFHVLNECRGQQEEAAITVLLKIILTVYERCRSHVEHQNNQIIESMCMFAGVQVGELIIQGSMHILRNFRAKHISYTMGNIKKIIEESLPSIIGSDVYIDCQDYIAECTKVCWIMCIKSPPMYISAANIDKFDNSLYTSYTKSGTRVSYVVWPTLFQYENGPIMKKGVAQGTN